VGIRGGTITGNIQLTSTMSLPANLVTIHSYFKVHPGKEEQVATILE
jgi:hypothetical protein